MSKFARALKIVGVIAAIVCIGTLLGWLASRGKPGTNPQPSPVVVTTDTAATESSNHSSLLAPGPRGRPTSTTAHHGSVPTPPSPANLITNWEDKLDQILAADGNEADKAKQMLAMFPNLPTNGQEEVAQHLSNLTADEDYVSLGQYLTNSTLSEPVLDVLLADLLNRPNSLKLPLLYEIARQGPDQNPKAGDARDILELYLDDNYGEDWNKWQAKMEQWLKDNPD